METQNNSGAIFRNEKKDKPTAPDYTGSARINDQDYKVSGWINKSRDGKNYLRVLFNPKELNNTQDTSNTEYLDPELPF